MQTAVSSVCVCQHAETRHRLHFHMWSRGAKEAHNRQALCKAATSMSKWERSLGEIIFRVYLQRQACLENRSWWLNEQGIHPHWAFDLHSFQISFCKHILFQDSGSDWRWDALGYVFKIPTTVWAAITIMQYGIKWLKGTRVTGKSPLSRITFFLAFFVSYHTWNSATEEGYWGRLKAAVLQEFCGVFSTSWVA